MAPRLRLALIVVVLCATMLVVIVALSVRGGVSAAGGTPPVAAGSFYGARAPSGFPAVEFALPDQDGATIRLSAFAGQVVIATFVYSTCRDTCPLVVQQLFQALGELRHPVPALAISVDPGQDTPANVNAFLIKEHVVGRLHYLVAPKRTLAPIWRQFGVQPQRMVNSPVSDHSIDVVIFDKSGRARVGYTDVTMMDPDAIAADIRTLRAQAAPRVAPRRVNL